MPKTLEDYQHERQAQRERAAREKRRELSDRLAEALETTSVEFPDIVEVTNYDKGREGAEYREQCRGELDEILAAAGRELALAKAKMKR